jgi:hypothetical protein
VLTCRANVFTNPDRLISYIAKHPEGACVHPDMTVVFSDEWDAQSAAQRRGGNSSPAHGQVATSDRVARFMDGCAYRPQPPFALDRLLARTFPGRGAAR